MHSFTVCVNTDDMEGFLLPSSTKAFTTQVRSYWLWRLDHPLNFLQLNKQLQLREVQTSGLTVFRSTQCSLKTEFQQVTHKIQQKETRNFVKPDGQMHEIIRLVLDLCLPSLFFPLNNRLAHRSQCYWDETEHNNTDSVEKEKTQPLIKWVPLADWQYLMTERQYTRRWRRNNMITTAVNSSCLHGRDTSLCQNKLRWKENCFYQ